MRDHLMGYAPAAVPVADAELFGCICSDCLYLYPYPCGVPVRIEREWQARHDAMAARERIERERPRLRIDHTCKTAADTRGVQARADQVLAQGLSLQA